MKYSRPELTDSHKKAMAPRVSGENEETSLFLSHVEMIFDSNDLQLATKTMFGKKKSYRKSIYCSKKHLVS